MSEPRVLIADAFWIAFALVLKRAPSGLFLIFDSSAKIDEIHRQMGQRDSYLPIGDKK